jgi:hypothetical protein
MSEHVVAAEDHGELAPAELAAAVAAPLPAAPALPRPTVTRRVPSVAMPIGRSTQSAPLEKFQRVGNRALAELSYQLRRVGTATLAGAAAVGLAVVVLITGNLPQVSAITALRNDLLRLTPLAHGRVAPAPTGSALSSLPPRAEAPTVVAKILEEAEASGVELPRGQYEFIPPRDGMAARYRMTFPVHASYPKIRDFIDRSLVAMPAVAIEGLRIERKNVADDSVDAELKFSAYVRSDP